MNATYRVHLIYTRPDLPAPASFRVEVQAESFEEAWRRARAALYGHAQATGWEGVEIISSGSAERVPDDQA